MGLFSRKPSRGLEAELAKQASHVLNVFGYALQSGKVLPKDGFEPIDLNLEENRTAIRDQLIHLVREQGLLGCSDVEIGSTRLMPLAKEQSRSPLEDAALISALAINSINGITRCYYEDYPKYQPLFEMVNQLAKVCCSGAAQTIGPDLPDEVTNTWPYFAHIFEDAKRANLMLWPDVQLATEKMYREQVDGLPLTKNGGLKVELVPMPSGDNPWRTRADYRSEQRRDTVRFYITIATLIISILSVVCTAIVAVTTIMSLS